MEQEETRAVRTREWLYMKRFRGSSRFPFRDALYDLVHDPGEKRNVIDDRRNVAIARELSGRIDIFFDRYANPAYDLWHGGRPKSNSDKPWLWQDAWGEEWAAVF